LMVKTPKRVPLPPARMTAFIFNGSLLYSLLCPGLGSFAARSHFAAVPRLAWAAA